jgi:hypothetical protein
VPNKAFIQFLEYYNVSRVALIYGPESYDNIGPAFQDSSFNIKKEILASKIELVANIAVTYRLLNENDKKTVFGLLKSSDARLYAFRNFKKVPIIFSKIYNLNGRKANSCGCLLWCTVGQVERLEAY